MIKELIVDNKTKKLELDILESTKILFVCVNGGELDVTVNLKSKGAHVDLFGIVLGRKKNVYKIQTLCNHEGSETKSRVLIKGVFYDSSHFNYEGMIRIGKNAQLANAYLRNDNLVLGDDAVVNSSPQLEILANDVKASHGVTIRDLDDESNFYMKSRGLNSKSTRNLFTYGFVNEVISQFKNPAKIKTLLKLKHE